MNALGNFNPGDKTEVVFLRDGKKQKSPVTFE
jgi:S1-C subfamily serine protease